MARYADETTGNVLASMLKENTGRHFLDSGGAYGRNWERNQRITSFDEMPVSTFKFTVRKADEDGNDGELEIDFSSNVYHWLRERLQFDAAETRRFNWFCRHRDDHPMGLVDDYLKALETHGEKYGHTLSGPYWSDAPVTINTYNEENHLSQTLQFTVYTYQDTEYCLLSIHGGCDVRGGYTYPQAFTTSGHSEDVMFDYARCGMSCESGDHRWDSDNGGCTWTEVGDGHHDKLTGKWIHANEDLKNYPVVLLNEPITSENPIPDEQEALPGFEEVSTEIKRLQHRPGVIRVDEDGNGYCPECGEKLSIYPW